MAELGSDIRRAAEILQAGNLVAVPTETVYGLAGNALDPLAVTKIFQTKNRPSFDPLIVHVADISQVLTYAAEIPDELKKLADVFWPGPLTLLLPKRAIIPDLVTSGLETVAVRVPAHPVTSALLQALDFPLAAPSANPFGYISPTQASHVEDQLGSKIDYILDGGNCEVGLESTIVGLEHGQLIVYRLGGIPVSAIEQVVGPVLILPQSSSNPKSPGMLKSHYAPGTSVLLGDLDELVAAHEQLGVDYAVLSFSKDYPNLPPERKVILSPSGDFGEAARHLFSGMRFLDKAGVSVILAQELPEKNLGKAINDRLRRAAAK
ncbi:TsaC protein (YrdC-Sua5 domain) required for threonylcarbamoyladenosine t(6)A37 modification in tRNA [Lunatimonas lonarensis]|uniref:Threonylcarbamoyl-AMP synthase n=1 Tax=Lunatimonas lonarensis TaxID=1232681 RepID=R7ZQD0_9BACT|nr:L-threonylcarbamoyladenylate synthase [Lunatimonas lonarensis]EON76320.1 TsaC protein (YrdC-Sua5 domain) required for threonylcarbamoyladenosine t(6)A37 modification in tRNA [Lunatimonas lonarensis]